jgi:putative flippase GtrA
MAQSIASDFIRRPGLQQFIKFCIIGATSTVIDVGIFTLLFNHNWNPILARCISVAFGVTNGFIWNSLWTFRGMGTGRRHEQFVKFAAVNVVGLGLNITIMQSIFYLFTGHFIRTGETDKLHTNIGLAIAIVIVSCWNFLANKKWTFGGVPTEQAA